MFKKFLTQGLAVFLGFCFVVKTFDKVFQIVFGNNFEEDTKLAIWFVVGLFSIIILFQASELIWYRFYIKRKSRYAKAMKNMSGAFVDIYALRDKKVEGDERIREIANALTSTCHHVSQAFSQITERDCSTCIKVITPSEGNDQSLLITIARDRNAHSKGRKAPDEHLHTVNGNSDFKELVTERARRAGAYYLSNNIPWLREYENSSIVSYKKPYPYTGTNILLDFFIFFWRSFSWPLPYRSTLIVPIEPLRAADEINGVNNFVQKKKTSKQVKPQIVGFICVDSDSLYAFEEKYDVDLLKGVAEGIYVDVKTLTEKSQK